jgi:hypothetical protein
MSSIRAALSGALIGAVVLAAASAQAEEHERHGGGSRSEHYDARYSHNHYYPTRGAVVRELPGERFVVSHPTGRYFYSSGAWYAPRGPRFVVVGAPIGVFVPVLPAFYTTLWIGGFPYYYANDTYYAWRGEESGYEVVEPPGDQGATTQAPPSDELFIYPQNGQPEDQQAKDKYECHQWASSQSGFDPTRSGGGVPPDQLGANRTDYQRAMRACLEGRGYSVR